MWHFDYDGTCMLSIVLGFEPLRAVVGWIQGAIVLKQVKSRSRGRRVGATLLHSQIKNSSKEVGYKISTIHLMVNKVRKEEVRLRYAFNIYYN